MNSKKIKSVIAVALCGVFGFSAISLAACDGDGAKKDSIVIMTEELSGLFNPFYATSGTDMDVVGMTQISMLSTDRDGNPVAGDDLPTVVKDFEYETDASGNTVYTFIIKNGLKFSDGVPLTMNDVLFNMYEYLDPVYTGSSTMYSIDIKGLANYRTQQNVSGDMDEVESQQSQQAAAYAQMRIDELYQIYVDNFNKGSSANPSYSATESQVKTVIESLDSVSSGYMSAVATESEQATWTIDNYRQQLIADYDFTAKTFREELESDYIASKESYDTTTLPYSEHADKLQSDVFKFLLYEGYITPVYVKVQGKDDLEHIEKFEGEAYLQTITTVEQAIERVFNDNMQYNLDDVLTMWGTAGTLLTQYTADALSNILRGDLDEGSELAYPNISGIVSLGHTTSEENVVVNDKTYAVAHDHNADGTPVNADEYDVLQITVEGTDPKAIYNFGFSVAPAHYYTADAEHPNGREIDIVNNKFGVEWSDSDFQANVIQSQQHQEVPVGAGPYMATNRDNGDNPAGTAFWSSNIVYFKANRNFMFEVKNEKLRMQVVSSTDAIDKLVSGEVDYIVPQFTLDNANRLTELKDQGITQMSSWQLGYGYIGINAGKVPDINIRRAIMAAMNVSLSTEYYQAGTCVTLDWPMSRVSWAYPFETSGSTDITRPSKQNGHDYTQWTTEQAAKEKIRKYMNAAHNGAGATDADLSITFTIAGSSISEHPCYAVFRKAQSLLNEMGWKIELKADSQALTKLATGSLEVWAAAWGSTIDPDMYQVYHMNSTASSVYAWGYREIKANKTLYAEEYEIISQLSVLIDEGRETMKQAERKDIYEDAMRMVLDLAVEMPVYQRQNLYAYNSKTVTGFNNDVNYYSTPLEKVWELSLVG